MPKEKPQIFFCYSRVDSDFTLKMAKDLREVGANIWIDQLDVPAGQRWDLVTEQALKDCDRLLAILSPTSVESQNVRDELHYAIEEKKDIIPVLYKNCDIPYRIRRFQYIDFTGHYDQGRTHLLDTLRIVEEQAEGLRQPETEKQTKEENQRTADKKNTQEKIPSGKTTEPVPVKVQPNPKQQLASAHPPKRRNVWLSLKMVRSILLSVSVVVVVYVYFIADKSLTTKDPGKELDNASIQPTTRRTEYSFRKTPQTLSHAEAKMEIIKNGFFEPGKNKDADGIEHQYERLKHIDGHEVIFDGATGLTWQRSGSSYVMNYRAAHTYVDSLNKVNFAGSDKWRLPTHEEAMSLIAPMKNSDGLSIDPRFNKTQSWIWTADKWAPRKDQDQSPRAWFVGNINGNSYPNPIYSDYYVRAVH